MQYAASLANGGACGDPRTLADLGGLAEKAGWDAVLLADYIVHRMALEQAPPYAPQDPSQFEEMSFKQRSEGSPTYDPWVALAAMATRTTRIRLGTLVTALPRRRPWKL